jgi:hypothetical protein
MSNIVKVDPKEFGLSTEEVKTIDQAFQPMIVERNGYVPMYENLIKAEITPKLCSEAGDLRKKLVKVRTGIAGVHKTQKAYFLAAGRYVDAWKNKETLPVQQMEDNLKTIEEHYERIEHEKIQKLQKSREKQLEPFGMDVVPDNLGKMKDQDWEFFYKGAKASFEEKKKAEKALEEEQKEEKRRRDLMFSLGLKWDGQQFTKEDINFHWTDLICMSKEDFDKAFEGAKRRSEEIDAEQAKLKAENQELRKKEEERIQKEKEVERLEKIAIEAKLKQGDKAKIVDLINDLQDLKMKYFFKSEKNKAMFENVRGLLDKIVDYVENNTK